MFFTRGTAWVVILIILLVIIPLLMCIVCGVYCFRKKQLKKDPGYQLPMPSRSRSASRTTLKNINSDTSEMDDNSIKKVRRYDGSYDTHEPLKNKPNVDFGTKKMDLDEDDISSSEGSAFNDYKAKDIQYINMMTGSGADTQRQLGRRSQRLPSDFKAIEEADSSYPPPPIDSPQPYSPNSAYSPTFSNIDRNNSFLSDPSMSPTPKSPPMGAIRVLPLNQQQQQQQQQQNNSRYYGGPSSPLTQNVGLPQSDGRSTEV